MLLAPTKGYISHDPGMLTVLQSTDQGGGRVAHPDAGVLSNVGISGVCVFVGVSKKLMQVGLAMAAVTKARPGAGGR